MKKIIGISMLAALYIGFLIITYMSGDEEIAIGFAVITMLLGYIIVAVELILKDK